jgi:hypothetical protein
VQLQGGWASLEVMRRVYAEVPVSARRSLLVGAARASSGAAAAPATVPAALDVSAGVPTPVGSAPSAAASSHVASAPVWELEEHVQCDLCFTWHSVDESVADAHAGDVPFQCNAIGKTCGDVEDLD